MFFALSTHLFHNLRLERRHLEAMAAHGFLDVELFATRTHIDYHDAARVREIGRWLRASGLRACSMHAPITVGFAGGSWDRAYSTASPDASMREEAVDETVRALDAARLIGCEVLVLHLGLPMGQPIPPGDNDAGAARRSLERIADACAVRDIRLAIEVIPNALSTADAVVAWLEGDLELGSTGACLEVGHAHLTGGAPEAADRLSGHIITTHIHDNRGQSDDHLVPFDGTIDWPALMGSLLKIGYGGPLVFELPDRGDAAEVLTRAVACRARIQAILDDLSAPFPFQEE